MSRLSQQLTYRLYAFGWGVVKRMPERTAYKLFELIADRIWARRGKGVTRLELNLARVLGPEATPERVREVSHQGMRNYLRYWCDVFRLETWSQERADSTFHVASENLEDGMASGRGVVLALPHMGNWDHAGFWAAGQFNGFATVMERLKPEPLYERFVAYRESVGMEVLPLTGGQSSFLGLVRRLKAGGLVCLVAERDLTDRGVPVQFFGETTKLPAGPAALALSTGALLLPVTLWYEKDYQRAIVHPEIKPPAEGTRDQKVADMCQRLADVFAQGIAEHPADWHMLQRLWLVDLDPAHDPAAGEATREERKERAEEAQSAAGPGQ
ncbi:MAG TPA: phosphatidylinositol mannoside acyltransferase [Actinocrinis sp.]|jgi:KDO2-lipid IV(A) lauroyltransferase|uniref:phosphatidylinositol mannoside acyltransferase n=1 Tax=Actinocrinis sp. TaxID=1920516 RepID=UPI002DDD81CB|nr:phosphatidylinositol mannoside acyltransferase [Actinocrinis sp.]HEV3173585.1 phosphatidylinositol mannoside acyltransferase [Actinocrinis sp.]